MQYKFLVTVTADPDVRFFVGRDDLGARIERDARGFLQFATEGGKLPEVRVIPDEVFFEESP